MCTNLRYCHLSEKNAWYFATSLRRVLQLLTLLGFTVAADWLPALAFAPFVFYHVVRNAEEGYNVFDAWSANKDALRERKISFYLVKIGLYAIVGVLLIYRLANDYMGVLLSGPIQYMLTSLVGADKFKAPEPLPKIL